MATSWPHDPEFREAYDSIIKRNLAHLGGES
jgi:hypothetical protein